MRNSVKETLSCFTSIWKFLLVRFVAEIFLPVGLGMEWWIRDKARSTRTSQFKSYDYVQVVAIRAIILSIVELSVNWTRLITFIQVARRSDCLLNRIRGMTGEYQTDYEFRICSTIVGLLNPHTHPTPFWFWVGRLLGRSVLRSLSITKVIRAFKKDFIRNEFKWITRAVLLHPDLQLRRNEQLFIIVFLVFFFSSKLLSWVCWVCWVGRRSRFFFPHFRSIRLQVGSGWRLL